MKYTFCWVIAALLTEVYCERFTEIVNTDKGAVRGRISNTVMNNVSYSLFTDIPYAKPPVGDLRFRDPIEADPWTGVWNATEDCAKCVQYLSVTHGGSEDCLYLNVFTPVLNFTKIDKLLPVMIWIYGGAFVSGSTTRSLYGPDIILENNVVFVDMNYRLGPLGFLSLGIDGARGNQGLKDQNMAMRWVQKNIAKFGGDPNKVTIFGESAGADSIILHLLSPQSNGLFHQAISQSGSPICPWAYHTPTEAHNAAHAFAAHLGIVAETDEQLLEALKKADINDTIKAVSGMIGDIILHYPLTLPFNPTIDVISSDPSPEKVFLDNCPITKLNSGDFAHVPTMIGYNKNELNILDIGKTDPDLLRQDTLKRLNDLFALNTIGIFNDFTSLLDTVATGPISELETIATAFHFSGPIDTTQKLLTKHNGNIPVYYYRLSYSKNTVMPYYNLDLRINGPIHGADIPLLFCNSSAPHLDPNSEYNVYRKQFVSLWTNFAKYGNPTPDGQPIRNGIWLPSGEEGRQIDFGDEEFKMQSRLLGPVFGALASLYAFLLPGVSECIAKSIFNIL